MRRGACALLLSVLACGCAPPVDLTKGLQIENVSTGWYDAGLVNGQNKLVPSVSFTLKNVSDQSLPVLQIQATFRRVTEAQDVWQTEFKSVTGSEGLAPGATTRPLVVNSTIGYTGSGESREDMLKNSHFVDAEVELLAKYGSVQWKSLAKYPVARRLLTKTPS